MHPNSRSSRWKHEDQIENRARHRADDRSSSRVRSNEQIKDKSGRRSRAQSSEACQDSRAASSRGLYCSVKTSQSERQQPSEEIREDNYDESASELQSPLEIIAESPIQSIQNPLQQHLGSHHLQDFEELEIEPDSEAEHNEQRESPEQSLACNKSSVLEEGRGRTNAGEIGCEQARPESGAKLRHHYNLAHHHRGQHLCALHEDQQIRVRPLMNARQHKPGCALHQQQQRQHTCANRARLQQQHQTRPRSIYERDRLPGSSRPPRQQPYGEPRLGQSASNQLRAATNNGGSSLLETVDRKETPATSGGAVASTLLKKEISKQLKDWHKRRQQQQQLAKYSQFIANNLSDSAQAPAAAPSQQSNSTTTRFVSQLYFLIHLSAIISLLLHHKNLLASEKKLALQQKAKRSIGSLNELHQLQALASMRAQELLAVQAGHKYAPALNESLTKFSERRSSHLNDLNAGNHFPAKSHMRRSTRPSQPVDSSPNQSSDVLVRLIGRMHAKCALQYFSCYLLSSSIAILIGLWLARLIQAKAARSRRKRLRYEFNLLANHEHYTMQHKQLALVDSARTSYEHTKQDCTPVLIGSISLGLIQLIVIGLDLADNVDWLTIVPAGSTGEPHAKHGSHSNAQSSPIYLPLLQFLFVSLLMQFILAQVARNRDQTRGDLMELEKSGQRAVYGRLVEELEPAKKRSHVSEEQDKSSQSRLQPKSGNRSKLHNIALAHLLVTHILLWLMRLNSISLFQMQQKRLLATGSLDYFTTDGANHHAPSDLEDNNNASSQFALDQQAQFHQHLQQLQHNHHQHRRQPSLQSGPPRVQVDEWRTRANESFVANNSAPPINQQVLASVGQRPEAKNNGQTSSESGGDKASNSSGWTVGADRLNSVSTLNLSQGQRKMPTSSAPPKEPDQPTSLRSNDTQQQSSQLDAALGSGLSQAPTFEVSQRGYRSAKQETNHFHSGLSTQRNPPGPVAELTSFARHIPAPVRVDSFSQQLNNSRPIRKETSPDNDDRALLHSYQTLTNLNQRPSLGDDGEREGYKANMTSNHSKANLSVPFKMSLAKRRETAFRQTSRPSTILSSGYNFSNATTTTGRPHWSQTTTDQKHSNPIHRSPDAAPSFNSTPPPNERESSALDESSGSDEPKEPPRRTVRIHVSRDESPNSIDLSAVIPASSPETSSGSDQDSEDEDERQSESPTDATIRGGSAGRLSSTTNRPFPSVDDDPTPHSFESSSAPNSTTTTARPSMVVYKAKISRPPPGRNSGRAGQAITYADAASSVAHRVLPNNSSSHIKTTDSGTRSNSDEEEDDGEEADLDAQLPPVPDYDKELNKPSDQQEEESSSRANVHASRQARLLKPQPVSKNQTILEEDPFVFNEAASNVQQLSAPAANATKQDQKPVEVRSNETSSINQTETSSSAQRTPTLTAASLEWVKKEKLERRAFPGDQEEPPASDARPTSGPSKQRQPTLGDFLLPIVQQYYILVLTILFNMWLYSMRTTRVLKTNEQPPARGETAGRQLALPVRLSAPSSTLGSRSVSPDGEALSNLDALSQVSSTKQLVRAATRDEFSLAAAAAAFALRAHKAGRQAPGLEARKWVPLDERDKHELQLFRSRQFLKWPAASRAGPPERHLALKQQQHELGRRDELLTHPSGTSSVSSGFFGLLIVSSALIVILLGVDLLSLIAQCATQIISILVCLIGLCLVWRFKSTERAATKRQDKDDERRNSGQQIGQQQQQVAAHRNCFHYLFLLAAYYCGLATALNLGQQHTLQQLFPHHVVQFIQRNLIHHHQRSSSQAELGQTDTAGELANYQLLFHLALAFKGLVLVVQVTLQTVLIRASNWSQARAKLRQAYTFLMFANLSLWALEICEQQEQLQQFQRLPNSNDSLVYVQLASQQNQHLMRQQQFEQLLTLDGFTQFANSVVTLSHLYHGLVFMQR